MASTNCNCSNCYVAFWLDTVEPDEPTTSRKRKRAKDLPTPSLSSSSRADPSRSPKRTRIEDDLDTAPLNRADSAPAATSVTSSFLPLRRQASTLSFAHLRHNTGSVRSSTRSKSSRRSTSPIKRLTDLRSLAKPVNFLKLPDNDLQTLPDDIRDLFTQIQSIREQDTGFIPAPARSLIQEKTGKVWPARLFVGESQETGEGTSEAQKTKAKEELGTLLSIQLAVAENVRKQRVEAAWNITVHYPLLELAARDHPGITTEPIQSASILPQCLPKMAYQNSSDRSGGPSLGSDDAASQVTAGEDDLGDGLTAGGKMVDFAYVLELEHPDVRNTALSKAVHRLVAMQPMGQQTINQTAQPALTLCPIGLAVETKPARPNEEACVQLGIWTAAWHCRMGTLFPALATPGGRIISVPLVVCGQRVWDLFFAVDQGTHVDILGPVAIGNLDSLRSIYVLLAVLRHLVAWIDQDFRAWLTEILSLG